MENAITVVETVEGRWSYELDGELMNEGWDTAAEANAAAKEAAAWIGLDRVELTLARE